MGRCNKGTFLSGLKLYVFFFTIAVTTNPWLVNLFSFFFLTITVTSNPRLFIFYSRENMTFQAKEYSKRKLTSLNILPVPNCLSITIQNKKCLIGYNSISIIFKKSKTIAGLIIKNKHFFLNYKCFLKFWKSLVRRVLK